MYVFPKLLTLPQEVLLYSDKTSCWHVFLHNTFCKLRTRELTLMSHAVCILHTPLAAVWTSLRNAIINKSTIKIKRNIEIVIVFICKHVSLVSHASQLFQVYPTYIDEQLRLLNSFIAQRKQFYAEWFEIDNSHMGNSGSSCEFVQLIFALCQISTQYKLMVKALSHHQRKLVSNLPNIDSIVKWTCRQATQESMPFIASTHIG